MAGDKSRDMHPCFHNGPHWVGKTKVIGLNNDVQKKIKNNNNNNNFVVTRCFNLCMN